MPKLPAIAMVSLMFLTACGSSDSSDVSTENAQEIVETVASKWELSETKDAFTDQVSRSYTATAVSGSGTLTLSCSKKGQVNLYLDFPAQEIAGSMAPETATVRIDGDKPYEEPWTILYTSGTSWPQNSDQFISKLSGRSKLAVEIFAGTRSVFEIDGLDSALAGIKEVGCSSDEPQPEQAVDSEPSENTEY